MCGKKLTKGVEQRIEDLADRSENIINSNAPGFMKLLPLSEIIAAVLNVDSPSTRTVWKEYNMLIDKFGNEYAVLIDASKEEICSIVNSAIGNAIIQAREGGIKVTPGYDGVYGKLDLNKENELHSKSPCKVKKQSNLSEFW